MDYKWLKIQVDPWWSNLGHGSWGWTLPFKFEVQKLQTEMTEMFFWLTMAHYGTRRPEDGIFSWGKWCLTNGFRGSKYWPSGDCLSWKFLPLHVGFWSSHGPLSSPDFLHLICIPGISQLLLWKFPMFHDWRLDTNVWWLNSNRHT
jgi:hypothetical protein